MSRTAILAVAVFLLASFALTDATAAGRLGGGRSLGAQRQSVAPPATSSSGAAVNPVMPTRPGAGTPATTAPAATPSPSGASRWLGPIAGLAAGLGLAALLAHFGLPEGFGSLLLLALVAIGVVLIARMLLARRTPVSASSRYASASATATGSAPRRIEPVLIPAAAAAPSTNFAKRLPPGFDADGFLRQAKLQFGRLQAAWDAGDRRALADVMTPEMMDEIGADLAARGEHRGTEVVTLNAEMLEVTTEDEHHWASVRFTGLVREAGAPAPESLDEIWNLTKPVDGSTGWLLAGIRQTA